MSYPLRLPATEPLVTLTNPKPHFWILELHNGQDNRLTETLIEKAIKPALDAVEKHWRGERSAGQKDVNDKESGKGALIIVGRRDQDKFFSNGLDFANAMKNPGFFPNIFDPLLLRLLTYPIPTIAAINGHCFAGGFALAMACDYRVMTDASKRNAWLCMNEVHFGAPWPLSFAALFKAKVSDQRVLRRISIEGDRITPSEALKVGLLDAVVPGDTSAIVATAEKVADKIMGNARSGVWGLIKRGLYSDAIRMMQTDIRPLYPADEDRVFRAKM